MMYMQALINMLSGNYSTLLFVQNTKQFSAVIVRPSVALWLKTKRHPRSCGFHHTASPKTLVSAHQRLKFYRGCKQRTRNEERVEENFILQLYPAIY